MLHEGYIYTAVSADDAVFVVLHTKKEDETIGSILR
jgi:hypothetical protein